MRLRKRHFVNEFWIHIIILSPSDKLLCCILATSLEYYNKINNQCFMKYYIYIYFIYLIEKMKYKSNEHAGFLFCLLVSSANTSDL